MKARIFLCSCGAEFRWESRMEYHEIILIAQKFLQHRHDRPQAQCAIPRRRDEWQALDDIHWAAKQLAEAHDDRRATAEVR